MKAAITVLCMLAVAVGPLKAPTIAEKAAFSIGARHALIDAVEAHVSHDYVSLEKIPAIESALERARGTLESIPDQERFAAAVTGVLYAASHDKHMYLRYHALPITMNTDQARTQMLDAANGESVGTFARLPGNVGYLDFRPNFPMADEAEDAYGAVMTLAASTDALVIDLRRNHGGGSANRLLISYVVPAKVPITTLKFRDGTKIDVVSAENLKAPRYVSKPVVVLTSSSTASAAEGVAYALQAFQRATIVGQTTAGAGNPNRLVQLNEHFNLFVAVGQTINARTHTGWEGMGVVPDTMTPEAATLARGRAIALTKARSASPEIQTRREDALKDPKLRYEA